jgi:RNA polymerase sigma factor (sigma-70 family)
MHADLQDFGRFYDAYVRSMLAFFQRRVGDPEVAADLTAETFAAALVGRARFRGGDSAAAWLFSIAHHKLADFHRRGHAETRMRARLGMERVEVTAEDAELIRWLGDEVATQLIEQLPAEQRDAIRAHVLDDRDYAEIAREQQASEVAVRQRVSRGLRILREKMR